VKWDGFIKFLILSGLCLIEDDDSFELAYNTAFWHITTCHAYCAISERFPLQRVNWWHSKLGDWPIPPKVKCFIWFAL